MSLSGSPVDFLLAFSGGVLLSFTPCIYPLLPITIAYIGASSASSKIRAFSLSLIYVTGISITYAILGLAAALTGSIFGRFSSLPLVRIIAGLIIIFFGFTLWTGSGLRLPGLKLPTKKSTTYLSCFILGIASGLVISPCTAPALGSILIFVATRRNLIYGTLLLLSFAYGMGLLLIIAGTFSSILTVFPKSGQWMRVIKRVCAVILIFVGFHFFISGVNLIYAQNREISIAALDFSLRDLDGNEVTLSEFKNKKSVILFFWSTACRLCAGELHRLNQIYPTFIMEDIEVLAINVQESEFWVHRFINRNPVVFKVLLDSFGYVAESYRLIGYPTFILINKRGEIVFYDNYFPKNTYKKFLFNKD